MVHKKNAEKRRKMQKKLMVAAGWSSVGLGILGMFLPILPTTPFILLAAWLFCRSSKSAEQWLLNHKIFGKIVENYRTNKGIPLHVKIIAISTLWGTMAYSIFWVVEPLWLKILLGTIATGVTIHILRYKTIKTKNETTQK